MSNLLRQFGHLDKPVVDLQPLQEDQEDGFKTVKNTLKYVSELLQH